MSFRSKPPRGEANRTGRPGRIVMTLALALIALGLALRFRPDLLPDPAAPPLSPETPIAAAGPGDTLSTRFGICDGPVRDDCVVDGDTFWMDDEKYRIADINTPEISDPRCDAELALGLRARHRLRALLNAAPYSLAGVDRDTDRYGRRLRRVMRGGRSIGTQLVTEGLAEEWGGARREWC